MVALYNYTAREETDVSFVKGDRMEVTDDTETDWWRVIHLTTRQEGLIPWNFVAEERSVNSEEYVHILGYSYKLKDTLYQFFSKIHTQLVFRKCLAKGSRQIAVGRRESTWHISGASVRAQSKRVFIICKRLGRWPRLSCETLQN